MKITEDGAFRRELLKKMEEREFSERTGIHQSDLVYCLNKQAIRKSRPVENTDREKLLFGLGYATQRWLTGQDQDEPEKEVDGIIVTLDAHKEGTPWELKCTYQSSSRPIEESVHWIKQIMAQCYVTGTTTAYLSRLEIMGNWKSVFKPKGFKDWSEEDKFLYEEENQKPTLHAYRLEFTQDELDRFWIWLRERRDLFKVLVEDGVLLPKAVALASGMNWECSFCSYRAECEG